LRQENLAMKKLLIFVIVVFAFCVFLVKPSSVYAAECGIGHYAPGALADFGDMAPPSGLALMNWYNYYNGSAGAANNWNLAALLRLT